MKKKINIAELLKDCPKGTKLYSPIFGEVYLDKIRPHLAIVVTTDKEQGDFKEEFLYDGRYGMNGECMLYPSKGKTTWEGFKKSFKDGDVVATNSGHWIGITTGGIYDESIPTYCIIDPNDSLRLYFDKPKSWSFNRLATEEEKEKLFQAIKANGYKWNLETKTLEKLPKFKVGDRIKEKQSNIIGEIIDVQKNKYNVRIDDKGLYLYFREQDDWELVPNKFDITTLVPFESRVLVRDYYHQCWKVSFFGYFDKFMGKFDTVRGVYIQCIPYEGNEHLLGTTDDCDDFYKTWE